MKKKIPALILIAILAATVILPIAACSGAALYSEGTGELNVVCTNFPPFDFARVVGGEKVTVTILQDTGADLHNYSPTSDAIVAIKNADVLVCVGGTSDDAWLESTVNSAENPDLKIIKLTECAYLLPSPGAIADDDHEEHDHDHDHEEGEEHDHAHDEHVWTSLRNAKKAIEAIAMAFSEIDMANADYYAANATAYTEKLNALDAQYSEAVNAAANKTLVFADRFPFIYMTNDYGIKYYAAFSGCSTESNASFETLQKLTDAVKTEGISCVMITDVDPSTPPDIATSVASGAGVKILSMDSCQSVTRPRIEGGATYLDIMTQNLEVLKEALK